MAVSTPYPIARPASVTRSFFASEQQAPTTNPLISQQVDPTGPQIQGLSRISDPVQPTENAQVYVKNFDPDLYDLRDTSHLMRFVRALTGAPGIGGIRKQTIIARLSSMLSDGAFLDLDRFYGAIFGLQRHATEALPLNVDGTVVNPYLDLANSDVWDDALSRDARYRSRLFQLARAVNMGATFPGMKGAAEAVLNCDVDLVESWVKTDLLATHDNIITTAGQTYFSMSQQYVTYSALQGMTYGALQGTQFGNGQLPAGNRGELIFTPGRAITQEERYQLTQVLNTLKPSHTQVTIAAQPVQASSAVTPRAYSSDSENWQIQTRVTPAIGLVDPVSPIYANNGLYSQARPVFSEYSGEAWTYTTNVARVSSYRVDDNNRLGSDDEVIHFGDSTTHAYVASDGVRDTHQAVSFRLSGEGVVTALPYPGERPNYINRSVTV